MMASGPRYITCDCFHDCFQRRTALARIQKYQYFLGPSCITGSASTVLLNLARTYIGPSRPEKRFHYATCAWYPIPYYLMFCIMILGYSLSLIVLDQATRLSLVRTIRFTATDKYTPTLYRCSVSYGQPCLTGLLSAGQKQRPKQDFLCNFFS